ncbi:MAG: 4-aminobutyrate--2-oxoglutarate transaminase [Clostridiales bacterium]|nr:4-aminobutyrate--2-oxoglutarate transaminase [Clostridiales bacterium]
MMVETSANIVTKIPGPKSLELLNKREKLIARGVSYSTQIFAEEAKGALIKDVDGNTFIDMAAGIGVINIGHCDEEVGNAVKEQIDKFVHTSFNVCMYESYVEVAQLLTELTPGDHDKKVMFANSGAEAVENAVKISRKYTGKPMVVSLECAFHGRTYMAMTLTSKVKPYKDGFAPYCSDTFKIPSPYYYRYEGNVSEEEFGEICANKFDTLLKGELSPDMIACLIVEPLQGEGGFIVPPKGYLKRLQEICNQNNIVFIVDEIQAGFCRTGKFFCCEYADVTPDLITTSKSLAAGFPLSAVVGRSEMMDAAGSGGLGGTFSGNPVSLAAAKVVIEKMLRDDFAGKATHIGEVMMPRLKAMQEKHSVIGDVRGLGAMIALELVKDKVTKEPDKDSVGKIIRYCLEKGVIILSAGIFSNCIRFLPPLVISDEQLVYVLDTLEDAFSKL